MSGEVVIHKTRDRVSVSYARTINMGNYESVKVECGYSTDLKKEETVEAALDRAEGIASTKLNELCEPLEQRSDARKKR